ncbi:NAD(P)-binding protein [Sphingomonas sp. HDW15A]|uniref:NAD(P)-binding protein n=1 Tax=Sphingomonas sp. HDW15A TaxID=2714942 RepID=UPI00140BC625|nr:NAD(P)-binding protein [Sphingomonas sp. HDW15A]QIK97046.1 NAD(P)-binding protein [Sphingomonas sp. HDW15A]
MERLDTNYLIIGSGCSGLAFADTLLDQTDADIIIADRHAKPGGHWNDAYGFVRLHQPSAFYGVNSLELSDGTVDQIGLNQGMLHLASGAQVSAYFETFMERHLLPSGRVRYLPLTEWVGDGRLRSILGGEEREVAYRKLVDSTYYGTTVPSTHRPKFEVVGDARLVPPNVLPALWKERDDVPSAFVILGAGKTGMDTVAWLLQAGVMQQAIHWVRPRDAWLLNRAKLQPGLANFEDSIGGQLALMTAWAEASDVDELFEKLEAANYVLRIDRHTRPTMFHYATSSRAEVDLLATVETVIRDGHVKRIEPGRLVFEAGERGSPQMPCSSTAPRLPSPAIRLCPYGSTTGSPCRWSGSRSRRSVRR